MFKKLKLPSSYVGSADSLVFSFSGEVIWPIVIVEVPVPLGPKQKTVEFIMIDIESPYNTILGRGG